MGTEFPRGEREVSEAEWEELKLEAQKYYGLAVQETAAREKVSGSLRHILNNLATGLYQIAQMEVAAEKKPRVYESAARKVEYIKKYFTLLKDFPEFAAKERSPIVSALPNLFREDLGAEVLIDTYEAELRKPSG
jgi:hypothetical protein